MRKLELFNIWSGDFGNWGFDILTIGLFDNDYSLLGFIVNDDGFVWIDVLFLNIKIHIK